MGLFYVGCRVLNPVTSRSAAVQRLMVDKSETVDEIVFAETGDHQLLGARALEGLNLRVDARRKRLVAAGPIVSAAAVPPRFGRLVQVSERARKAERKTQTKASKRPPDVKLKTR